MAGVINKKLYVDEEGKPDYQPAAPELDTSTEVKEPSADKMTEVAKLPDRVSDHSLLLAAIKKASAPPQEGAAPNPPNQKPPENEPKASDVSPLPSAAEPYPVPEDPRPRIAKARELGNQGNLIANLNQAFNQMGAALGHGKADTGFSDKLRAQAQQPAKQAEEDIALERLSNQSRMLQMQNDPGSARNVSLATALEQSLGVPKGTYAGRLTSEQLERVVPGLASVHNANQNLGVRETELARKQSMDEFTNEYRTRAQADREKMDDLRAGSMATRDELAKMHAQLNEFLTKRKIGNEEAARVIPGIREQVDEAGQPVARPPQKEMDKFREAEAGHRSLGDLLLKMERIYNRNHGPPLPGSQDASDLDGFRISLIPKLYKDSGFNRFNEAEAEKLQAQIRDPQALSEWFNPRFLGSLKAFRQTLESGRAAQMSALGLEDDPDAKWLDGKLHRRKKPGTQEDDWD